MSDSILDEAQRLPYEPMPERQRAIDMVHALKVTKDGDTFDLIARLLRDRDRLDWLSAMRWAEIENHGGGSRIDGPDPAYGADTTLRAAIDAAMCAERDAKRALDDHTRECYDIGT